LQAHFAIMPWKCFLLALLLPLPMVAAELDGVQQLIVSIAPDWDSTKGRLQMFERQGNEWKAVSEPIAVLYGKNGLAWGRGVKGTNEPGQKKAEGDGKAPAGIFEIGKIYGYEPALPPGSSYPYHQVTDADVWSDDPRSPNYNRHMVIDPKNPPDNYSKERMRPGDFAYHWLIEIRHNSDPIIPGAGSAIFFHIRRGVNRPTHGCTSMAEEDVVKIIRWLRKEKNPHYALLPAAEYQQKWHSWGLPAPEKAAAILPSK
jgi:L,D-peptidoglycan transpeptidase YkuD (ErfK/YbiS/YcfS/YnhG family)